MSRRITEEAALEAKKITDTLNQDMVRIMKKYGDLSFGNIAGRHASYVSRFDGLHVMPFLMGIAASNEQAFYKLYGCVYDNMLNEVGCIEHKDDDWDG